MQTPEEFATDLSVPMRDVDMADLIRERDAEVKASGLRMAANALYDDDRANGKHGHHLSLAAWLRDLAHRIEREGGR